MRITRTLVLMVAAALTMTAFAGVGSAAAKPTGLCSKNEEVCGKENLLSGENFIFANWAEKVAPGTFVNLAMPGLGTVTCAHSKFQAKLSQTEGPLVGNVFKWWFLSCGPTGCTMETGEGELPNYGAELTVLGGGDGSLVVAKPQLIVNCTSPVKYKCIYEAPTVQFTVEGATVGEGGARTTSAAKMSKVVGSTAICPVTAELISNYKILEPSSPLFVTYR